MAACDGEERGPMSLLQSLEERSRCGECHEEKEDWMVLQCCQYSCCQQCFEEVNKNHELPECPRCSAKLDKSSSDVTECRLPKNLQRCIKAMRERLTKDAKGQCQAYGCERPIDFCCKNCKTFLCFRCNDLPCDVGDGQHNAVDIRVCVIESKETFELWKSSRLQNIAELKLQKKKIVEKMKLSAQQLVDAPDGDSVCEILEGISTEMSTANRDLQDNRMEMEQEVCSLNLMEKLMNNASGSEIELIHFVEQLQVFEQSRHLILGEYEHIGVNRKCYDISMSPAGHLVAAGMMGLAIIQVDTGECIKTIPIDEGSYAYVVESYKDTIVVGVTIGNEDVWYRGEVIIYDMEYNEIKRWSAPKYSVDLAVVDDKVFVVGGSDLFSGDISVFHLDGTPAPSILWNGDLACVASIPPCSIVYGDKSSNQVYKYSTTSGKRGVLWTSPVIVARCVTLDERGNVWIRSNKNNCFTILSRYGDLIQEIKADATRFTEISDLCIHKGYLYVSHDDGVGRYKKLFISCLSLMVPPKLPSWQVWF